MGAENLTTTGIQSLYCTAHNELLHRLCYPSPCCCYENKYKLQFRHCFRAPFLSKWTVAVKGLNSNEGHNYSNPATQKFMYDPILGQYVAVWYRSHSSHVVWDTIMYYDVDSQKHISSSIINTNTTLKIHLWNLPCIHQNYNISFLQLM